MDLNKLKKPFLAAKRLTNFICLSAIIFASFDSKENDFSPPKSFLGRSAQVICESFSLAFIVEVMVFLTWMLHLMLGLKENGWLSSLYLIVTHSLWICVTIFGLKAPSNKCNIVPLLLELLVLVFVISIAATLLLKLLFLISRLFFTDDGPYQPTETGSSQNDLSYQSPADIINDVTKEISTNSEQYLPSISFSNGDNFVGNTNTTDYFLSHTQSCGDVLTDRRSQTKKHENCISRSLRAMQPQEVKYHQGPYMLQTEYRKGPHRNTLQTESHQGQPTRPLQAEDRQEPHRKMLQTEIHQGHHTRPLQTEDLQHQEPQQKSMPTKTLLERRTESKIAASGAVRVDRLCSSQENIQQNKGGNNNTGGHKRPHTNMLQTGDHQMQPSRPLQTEVLQHQGPLQKTTPTKTLLERRAEAKRAASGAGGISRLCSSMENIQQSKGEINNNSNKMSDTNTEVSNVSSQGRREEQPPAQNSVCTTRSGLIYKRF